jgi:hypothetical protein
MEQLGSSEEAEAKVLADVQRFLLDLGSLTAEATSVHDGTARLRKIRSAVYENLNQIQHEFLILQGLTWLRANGHESPSLRWFWNPRQTGDATEPDLRAVDESHIIVSAEATTSERPDGVIDTRMRLTLAKLSQMAGDKFYFVRTAQMAQRARTKIAKNGWNIRVVQCD